MKGMLLAGGMSTRLYPLTKTVPKPLVPVLGEPVSAHVMRWLAAHGVADLAINVHYLAEKIGAAFGDGSRYGVRLRYLHETELTGSAGALKQMESFFADGTFVVVGCDDLTDADLTALVRFHKRRGALATIGLVEADEVDQFGVVILDEHGRITGFQEKPAKGTEKSKLANTGIYVFEPEILRHIPAGEFYDFGKNVFPALQAANADFFGMRLDGAYWRDVGTPSEYRLATQDALAGKVRLHGGRASGIASDARIDPSAQITGDVRIGAGVRVGAGARITGPSVVDDRVRIGDGAVLERAIVWEGTTIGANAHVVDAIVGIDYAVAPGDVVRDAIVAPEPVATSSPGN